jgi:hypothetical protein
MKKILMALCLSAVTVSGMAIAQTWSKRPGDMRTTEKFIADCTAGIALDSCTPAPTPQGCPGGRQWSIAGGVAHCVDNDPVCTAPAVLTHDVLGNPNCSTPPPPATTTTTETQQISCASGYSGYQDQERQKSVTAGVTSYSAWTTVYDACVPVAVPPAPTPPPAVPPAVPPPATPPAVCTASDTVSSSSGCPSGMVGGPIEIHDKVTCPGSTFSQYTTGACSVPPTPPVCLNGATNYPACTIMPTPPTLTYSWVAVAENSTYDAFAFSGGVTETYDCKGKNHFFQWYSAIPSDGPRLAALFAPGGDCYCGGTNPPNKDDGYRQYGSGGDYAWDNEYICKGE